MPNQTPPEFEAQILRMTQEYPTIGYVKLADQLKLVGVPASASQVRGVWVRHGFLKKYERLLWLEREAAAIGGPLTKQVRALLARYERHTADPAQYVEAPFPGYLGCQDTYFVGTIKGVGRVYAQTFVDAASSWAAAKLYLSKLPMTAVDLLHDRVRPVCEAAGIKLGAALDRHRARILWLATAHPLELYHQQIEHRNTKIHAPKTNGFCERFNRTLKEEFFSVANRKTLYESLQQLQDDLDGFLRFYNEERSHQGYRTRGRTPRQTFQDGLTAVEQPSAA